VWGGYARDTVEPAGKADLAADGIEVGDWYAIHAIEPGPWANVASKLSFQADEEPS
jgi:hypothetical protein